VSDAAILDVARAVLHADPTAPISTVAARVGLSQAALFKRFGTKLALLSRALRMDADPPWIDLARSGPDERPIPVQLRELGSAIDAFFHDMVPSASALRASGVDPRSLFGSGRVPPPVRGYEALRGWFERALAAGSVRAVDPASAAMGFMGAFQARAVWRHLSGDHGAGVLPDAEAYLAATVEHCWRGLAPEEGR
jgi:AcrR family transcriptional regulator